MANRSYKISAKAQKNVVNYLRMRYGQFDMPQVRHRLSTIDKAIQLESDVRRQRDGDDSLDYYEDTEISMISPAIDTMQGFFVDLYLGESPIFPVVSKKKENEEQVLMFNTLMGQHATEFKWGRHLALAFRDCAKYNRAAAEVSWDTLSATDIVPDIDPDTNTPMGEIALQSIKKEGNAIRRLDLYNTFYDTGVPLAEVHENGEYAGYVERLGMVQLVRKVENIKAMNGAHVMNEDQMFDYSRSGHGEFYVPDIISKFNLDSRTSYKTGGWSDFFGELPKTSGGKSNNPTTKYEVTTIFARIIPSMFGIKVPGADKVQVWKFVVVNWQVVIYAERQANVHSYLPIVFAQVREDGIGEQTKSTAELLIPLQNLSTKIYDARLASLARSVGQKFIYDRNAIESADVDNPSPSANIPFKRTALTGPIRDSILPVNFQDTLGQSHISELGFLKQEAQETTRLNRPQLGQFQRGNKTLGEFREVMNNANAELRVMGILLENQFIHTIKTILKMNILQFQAPTEATDPATGREVQIQPSQLREIALQFKVADGLISADEHMDSQLLREFMMLVREDPELRQSYDLVGMISYLFNMSGANVKQFERTQEEQQQAAAQGAVPPQQ